MRKPVLLIAFILATGCQVFTDLDGYTWYSDTDSGSDVHTGADTYMQTDTGTDTDGDCPAGEKPGDTSGAFL